MRADGRAGHRRTGFNVESVRAWRVRRRVRAVSAPRAGRGESYALGRVRTRGPSARAAIACTLDRYPVNKYLLYSIACRCSQAARAILGGRLWLCLRLRVKSGEAEIAGGGGALTFRRTRGSCCRLLRLSSGRQQQQGRRARQRREGRWQDGLAVSTPSLLHTRSSPHEQVRHEQFFPRAGTPRAVTPRADPTSCSHEQLVASTRPFFNLTRPATPCEKRSDDPPRPRTHHNHHNHNHRPSPNSRLHSPPAYSTRPAYSPALASRRHGRLLPRTRHSQEPSPTNDTSLLPDNTTTPRPRPRQHLIAISAATRPTSTSHICHHRP